MDAGLLVAGLVIILVFTAYMAAIVAMDRKKKTASFAHKVATATAGEVPYSEYDESGPVDIEEEKTGLAQALEGMLSIIPNFEDHLEQMKAQLSHAGINTPSAPAYALSMKWVIGPIIAFIGILYMLGGGTGNLVAGLLMVILGAFGTTLYISNKVQRRQHILLRSFPDTLDLLVVCVESGLALDAAFGRVCEELALAHPEMTKELNQTRLELALLNDRSQALQNLADRTDLIPFRSLVAALIQTEKFGTSLTDTLRVLSEDYRSTRLNLAEQKAGRLPTLMTIPLIVLLMPALFLVILGPPFIKVNLQGGLFGDR